MKENKKIIVQKEEGFLFIFKNNNDSFVLFVDDSIVDKIVIICNYYVGNFILNLIYSKNGKKGYLINI